MRKHTICLVLLIFFTTIATAQEEFGLASVYGDEFHGSETASGEAYDKGKLTAAHKTFPFGSKVRVTRLDTKKSVVVRINDRGPYLKGRVIDLSGQAASALDMSGNGNVEIKLELLSGKSADKKPEKTAATPVVPKKRVIVEEAVAPKQTVTPTPATQPEVTQPTTRTSTQKTSTVVVANKSGSSTQPEPEEEEEEIFELVTDKTYQEYGVYKVEIKRPIAGSYAVQVGVFSDYDNMMKEVARLQGKWFKNILVNIEKGTSGKLYKVLLGPFSTRSKASNYDRQLKKRYRMNGFVVELE